MPFGLIVRSGPAQRGAGRESLDLALVAASLEVPVRVFFLGHGLDQLRAPARDPGEDPPAPDPVSFVRGWKALPHHGDVRCYALAEELGPRGAEGSGLDVAPVTPESLGALLAECEVVFSG